MGDGWRAVGGDGIYSARELVSRTFTVLHIDQAFAPSLYFMSLSICVLKCWGKTQILINDINFDYKIDSVSIHIDNNSTLKLIRNPEGQQRIKYVNARHYFIRDAPILWLLIRLCCRGAISFTIFFSCTHSIASWSPSASIPYTISLYSTSLVSLAVLHAASI
jgi:hypothetical protein